MRLKTSISTAPSNSSIPKPHEPSTDLCQDIERHINAAVVVGDRERDVIEAEIREYVFTDELIEHFFKLLSTVLNKEEGKTGIWVNGYYGSGKSHFIKYFHYLLDGPTSDLAFEMLAEALKSYDDSKGFGSGVSASNLQLLRKKVQQTASEDIMFNLERETDDHEGERVTRIMLNMLNQHRGYNKTDIPLALLLEKSLDQAGKLDEFKSTIQDNSKSIGTKDLPLCQDAAQQGPRSRKSAFAKFGYRIHSGQHLEQGGFSRGRGHVDQRAQRLRFNQGRQLQAAVSDR